MLATAPETRVFILAGERDASAEGDALSTYEWKSNTQVFLGDCIQRVFIQKFGIEVTGIGYAEKTWSHLDLSKLSRGRKGKYQFLLLPGLEGKGTAEEIRALNLPFDYVGFGGSQVISGEFGPRVYAPGDFTPQDFSNQIEHGFYLGEISEGKEKSATIQFVPSENREYIALQLRLNEDSTMEKLTDDVRRIVKKYGENNIYHISLVGEGKPEFYFEKKALYEVGNVLCVLDQVDRNTALDRIEAAHEDDAIGRFLREMRAGEPSEAREKALDYGMEALLAAGKEAETC